jgi:lysophospholipase L1-like esterase
MKTEAKKMRVLVIGDSHAKGFLPHVLEDSDALAEALGSPPELRRAVSGSPARDWAMDTGMILSGAMDHVFGATGVVVSLGGNDAFRALADGAVTPDEEAALCCDLMYVLQRLAVPARRTLVLLYAYPYRDGCPAKRAGLARLNGLIAGTAAAVARLTGAEVGTFDEADVLRPEDFPGDDIHPLRSGYERLGRALAARFRDGAEGGPA